MGEAERQTGIRLGRIPDPPGEVRPEFERVRRAIDQGLVGAAYQPILDVQRLEVAGREALARPTEASGFKHPGGFFDDAERAGLLWDAERATRDTAIAGFAGSSDGSRLFVNASPSVIADERLTADLLRAVAGTPGLTPARVVVEITERSDVSYTDAIVSRAEELRAAGFEIAVDDVGAGTSGLNRIMAVRPDWIKLDHDLITGIDADRNKRNLVRFLVSFGRLSGVRVLAEGIERREELSTLMDLGVRYVQGFHIAMPGPVDQAVDASVLRWLERRQEELAVGRLSDPRRVPLSRFARKATVLEGSTKVSEGATELLRDRTCRGFVLVSGTRVVGWCGRDAVLRAAGDHRSFMMLESLAAREPVVIDPEIPVVEALESAATRVDSLGSDPLILASGGAVRGVVTVGDLLSAAATAVGEVANRTAPVTGLPSRAKADEHMAALVRLSRAGGAAVEGGPTFDAALIDIRRFSEFNKRMGYELGDDLLRRVGGLIQRTLLADGDEGAPRAFVAHLGDDRFLVTGPSGQLRDRLELLAAEFTRTEAGAGFGEETRDRRPTLRVLLFPGVFSRVRTVGEVHKLAESARLEDRSDRDGVIVVGDEESDRAFKIA